MNKVQIKNNNQRLVSKSEYRRRRLRLIPIIGILLLIMMGMNFAPSAKTTYFVREDYHVQSGDTLWNIAASYAGEKDDLRMIVDSIMEENQLKDSADIHPGDVLQIVIKH
ncbi:LysM domain protein [Aedoeadaptatus nemausensis]|uniref:LysM domain protein n=1 Tax=Aedoeadaptatus nemausensis TaxID=2582829 RepID=A0A6V6XZH2_9FIRM|nr:LysM domain-containing protein [Peptoniphilus nemausensis]CAC9924815.1 LysM domain protein [Peptoniphilus nemausensis]